MDEIAQIQRLGWEWRPDGLGQGLGPGVVLAVRVNGRDVRAFVPLARVWLTFDQELQKVGCVGAESVGAPFTVGGFFSFVKKAVKSVASVAKKVVPKAIQKAAARVVNTAKVATKAAWSKISSVPILGSVVKATANLYLLPVRGATQLLQGKRIDTIAIDQFKTALSSAKTLGPYAQTVIALVPGVGTGISAGIGGALALASGQPISEAMLAAVKSAVPGGALAQAAFSVASDAIQGKPLDQMVVNALPIDGTAKTLLVRGIAAAKDLAAGKNVAQTVLDQAIKALPPQYQKAVQIGVAMGQAKNLQQAAGAAVQGAAHIASQYAGGVEAAKQFAAGVRSPAVLQAMQAAKQSHGALTKIVQQAKDGHPQANMIVRAVSAYRPAVPRPQSIFQHAMHRPTMPRPQSIFQHAMPRPQSFFPQQLRPPLHAPRPQSMFQQASQFYRPGVHGLFDVVTQRLHLPPLPSHAHGHGIFRAAHQFRPTMQHRPHQSVFQQAMQHRFA